jgi:hypothetical protein
MIDELKVLENGIMRMLSNITLEKLGRNTRNFS